MGPSAGIRRGQVSQAVPANRAPYRYGHWASVQPWGWTWVDDAAWGFTPGHYGRWVQIGHRWAWVPGERVVRPVYAPALGSFFDLGGAGINVSLGWVPLGPQEVYVPPYRHSPRYVREVNITNVRNETTIINVVNNKTVVNVNNYRNYREATSVSRDVMEHGRPVGPAWGKNDGKTDRADFDQQWKQARPEQEVAFRPQGNAEGKPGNGPKAQPRTQQQNWQGNAQPASQAKAPKPTTPRDAAAEPKWTQPKHQQPAAHPKPQPEPTAKKAEWKTQQQPRVQGRQPQQAHDSRQTSKQQWKQPQGEKANQHSDKAPKHAAASARQPQQQKKPAQNCGQQPGTCQ